jgi:hypothetical protein
MLTGAVPGEAASPFLRRHAVGPIEQALQGAQGRAGGKGFELKRVGQMAPQKFPVESESVFEEFFPDISGLAFAFAFDLLIIWRCSTPNLTRTRRNHVRDPSELRCLSAAALSFPRPVRFLPRRFPLGSWRLNGRESG